MNDFRHVVLIASLLGCLSECGIAEQRGTKDPGEVFATAADQMFGKFFGESNAERKALERVEISPRDEQAIGERDLQGLLQSLRQRRIRVIERGKEAEYLNALVAESRPLMKNASRYPKLRIYVAVTKETDARAFPCRRRGGGGPRRRDLGLRTQLRSPGNGRVISQARSQATGGAEADAAFPTYASISCGVVRGGAEAFGRDARQESRRQVVRGSNQSAQADPTQRSCAC